MGTITSNFTRYESIRVIIHVMKTRSYSHIKV